MSREFKIVIAPRPGSQPEGTARLTRLGRFKMFAVGFALATLALAVLIAALILGYLIAAILCVFIVAVLAVLLVRSLLRRGGTDSSKSQ